MEALQDLHFKNINRYRRCTEYAIFIYLFLRFYLFLEIGEGKEKERERNIDV